MRMSSITYSASSTNPFAMLFSNVRKSPNEWLVSAVGSVTNLPRFEIRFVISLGTEEKSELIAFGMLVNSNSTLVTIVFGSKLPRPTLGDEVIDACGAFSLNLDVSQRLFV